jgi:hypothetical protein
MSAHQTTVVVKNPSAAMPLRISMQGQTAAKMESYVDYVHDTLVGSMLPQGRGYISGGQFDWDRRFMLVTDKPTTIEIVAQDRKFVVESLRLVNYDTGPTWEKNNEIELEPTKTGEKYELTPTAPISISINIRDESLDDTFLNLRNVGDSSVQIIQQKEQRIYRKTRASAWTPPQEAGDVAPGCKKEFTLNDNSRLVIDTDSERDLTLEFANTNPVHALRLFSIVDGKEVAVANITPPHAGSAALSASSTWTGQVTIRKGQPAIVMQSPQ